MKKRTPILVIPNMPPLSPPAAAGGNITTFTETDLPLDTSKRFYVIQRVGR